MKFLPLFRCGAIAAALLVVPNTSSAAWMSDYSGYSILTQPNGQYDGVVNFAVYHTETTGLNANDWVSQLNLSGDVVSLSLAAIDTSAKYVYFYQVVNTGNSTQLNSLFVAIDPDRLPTSAGATQTQTGFGAGGYVFTDANGNVGPTGNVVLGPSGGTPDLALDGIPSYPTSGPGTDPIEFANDGGALRATLYTAPAMQPSGSGYGATPAIQFSFGPLGADGYTTVMFFTSNIEPTYGRGSTGTSASLFTTADMPVPTPEPATLAMMAIGLPLAGVGYVRRIRKAKAEAAV